MKGCFNFLLSFLLIALFAFILFFPPVIELDPEPEPPGIELPPPPVVPAPRLPREESRVWKGLGNFLSCGQMGRKVFKACDYQPHRAQVLQAIQPANAGNFNLGQICDIYDYLRHWVYVNDPHGKEHFAPASQSWKIRRGDCDDFAIAMASALYAIGGYPRVVFAKNDREGHAFTEVCLGLMPEREIVEYLAARYQLEPGTSFFLTRDQNANIYLNLDWNAPYPGGPYFKATSKAYFYLSDQTCEKCDQCQ